MEVEDTGPDPSITEIENDNSLHNNTEAATGSSAAGLADTLSGILYTMYKQVLTSYLLGEDSTFLVPDHLNDSELSLLSDKNFDHSIQSEPSIHPSSDSEAEEDKPEAVFEVREHEDWIPKRKDSEDSCSQHWKSQL